MKSEKNIYSETGVQALVLCAGSGTRTGLSYNKLLHIVGTKTVLEMTLDNILASEIDSVTLVISPKDEAAIKELTAPYGNISLCYGGDTRSESTKNGLNCIAPCDIVVIHDGARPYVSPNLINECVHSAKKFGSGIAAIPCIDTIKRLDAEGNVTTLNRNELYNIQTPQAFRYRNIKNAYDRFDGVATDDSAVYEAAGFKPRFVAGSPQNKKITAFEDLFGTVSDKIKIGAGFDVHPLTRERKLIIGGVQIPHDKGLLGHSDADVLVHAIMDSLLSAAGLPDIGVLFPDTDEKYKNADSTELLKQVCNEIGKLGYKIGNISSVIMAQKPKLAAYIPQMRTRIATETEISEQQINISATTTEHLGIIGEEKGIAASATGLLVYNK